MTYTYMDLYGSMFVIRAKAVQLLIMSTAQIVIYLLGDMKRYSPKRLQHRSSRDLRTETRRPRLSREREKTPQLISYLTACTPASHRTRLYTHVVCTNPSAAAAKDPRTRAPRAREPKTFPNRHNGDFRYVKLYRKWKPGTWLPEPSEVKSTLTTAKSYCKEAKSDARVILDVPLTPTRFLQMHDDMPSLLHTVRHSPRFPGYADFAAAGRYFSCACV